MSIEEQARQVAIVKRAENGMIYDPVTIKRGSTVQDALDIMAEYKIGGIPVVDDEGYWWVLLPTEICVSKETWQNTLILS